MSDIFPREIISNKDANVTINGYGFVEGDIFINLSGVYSDTNLKVNATYVSTNMVTFRYPRGLIVPDTYNLWVENSNGLTDNLSTTLEIVDAATRETSPKVLELTRSQIISKVSPAVFYIENDKNSGTLYSSGSGVIISSNGYALTNHHVIEGDSVLSILLNNGIKTLADVIGWDQKYDIAVIKIRESGLNYLNLGNSNNTVVGDDIFVFGYPRASSLGASDISVN